MASPPRIIAEATFTKADEQHSAVTHSFAADDGTASNRVIVVMGAASVTGGGVRFNDTLSFGGNGLTRLRRNTSGVDNEAITVWFASAPASGTNDLAFTMNGTVDASYVKAYIIENAEQIFPASTVGSAAATTSVTPTVDPVSDQDLILALFAWEGGAGPFTEPAGFVEDDDQELVAAVGENLAVHVIREADAAAGSNVGVTSTAANTADGVGVVVAIGSAGATFVDADHSLAAPTQAASLDVIVKADAAHALAAPTQEAGLDVIVKADAAHSLAAPTQDASARSIVKTTAAHALAAPTQAAALTAAVPEFTADHVLPAPTQSATAKAIQKVAASQALDVPTMAAVLGVRSEINAAHTLGQPTQRASMFTGERRSFAIEGGSLQQSKITGNSGPHTVTGST